MQPRLIERSAPVSPPSFEAAQLTPRKKRAAGEPMDLAAMHRHVHRSGPLLGIDVTVEPASSTLWEQ